MFQQAEIKVIFF